MNINSALGSALYGIRKGLTGMDNNAAKIASADTFKSPSAADIAGPLVDLQSNRLQIEASAKVMTTLDETLGTLLDETA